MDIRTSISAVVLALALATPSLAQQTGSVRDFRLPPDPGATPTPEVQGPVDPEAEVRTTPRVIPTDTPTTSTPTPTPTPTLTLPASRPTPTRPAPADTPRQQPQPVPETAPTATPSPTPSPADQPTPQPTEFAPSIPPAASVPAATTVQPPESGSSIMIWLAALIAALGIAGGAFWYLRRREALAPVPVVEPPLVRRETQPDRPAPAPTPAPAARPAPPPPPLPGKTLAAPVTLHALPVRLSKSMMNATFAFRLVLENQGAERWEGVAVEADLVTAHGAVPIGEQVADPATALAPLSTLDALEPGDTRELAHEVRLPLGQVRAIPQGRAAVYVPLLRVRLTAKGRQPVARTFLIGQLPDRQGGRLRPFRLDEMPQSYNAIGLRPLD